MNFGVIFFIYTLYILSILFRLAKNSTYKTIRCTYIRERGLCSKRTLDRRDSTCFSTFPKWTITRVNITGHFRGRIHFDRVIENTQLIREYVEKVYKYNNIVWYCDDIAENLRCHLFPQVHKLLSRDGILMKLVF